MGIFDAIVLAIVEGITEILPVSGNGHLSLISALLEVNNEPFTPYYHDLLQFGVIAAILYLYWKRFTKIDSTGFYKKILLSAVPAIILFILFDAIVDRYLLTSRALALTLIVGGIIFLFIDFIFWENNRSVKRMSGVSTPNAVAIGFWQCIGIIPGFGRSAAAIIGGLQQGLTRKMAAEFAFFISVPTMLGITAYKLLRAMATNSTILRENVSTLAVGNVVSFVVALITVKFFTQFIEKNGFRYFGWYRILAGFVIFYLMSKGYID